MTISIVSKIFYRFISIKKRHLLWITVVFSILFTLTIVSGMSTVFHGRVTGDYLITGFVAAAVVSCIATFGLLIILGERQKVLAALLENEARLQYLLVESPAVIYTCTPTGDYQTKFISENIKEQLGYGPLEFLNNPKFWATHIHPEDAQRVFAGLSRLFERGRYVHEYRFLHKDGAYRWMRDDLRLVLDQSGGPLEIVGSCFDITERKQMEETLLHSEEYFRSIAEVSEIVIYRLSPTGEVRYVSPAVSKQFGYGPKDVIGRHFLDFVMPADHAAAYAAFQTLLSGESVMDTDLELRRADGALFAANINVTPIIRDGELFEIQGIIIDINKRKRAEEEVRRLAAEQKAILDNIASGVFFLKNSTVKWANRKVAELFGYPLEEIIGKEMLIFCLDRESFDQLGREAYPLLAKGKTYSVERQLNKKGGELIWCSIVAQAIDAVEPEQGSIWLLDDITERKTAEQSLQLLHKAVSTSQAGITFRDTNNIIIFTNDAEARMHGYDKSELIGRPAHILSPPDLRQDMNVEKMSMIAGWERERISIRKDGTTFPVHLVSDVVKDELGNPLGLVTICEDITERKKVEKKLRMYQDQLEHLVEERTAEFKTAINFLTDEIENRNRAEEALKENELKMRNLYAMKALGELAAGVAHEVRNPLHALMSVTEALKIELKDNPDFDIFLFHIRKQVERLSVLMKDLLDLGKPIEPSHLRAESLWNICMASIDLWKNSSSRRGHKVSFFQPPGDKDVIVTGDSQRLQQVFLNLLENAAYHSPENSTIEVSILEPAGDKVRVRVTDQGAGIPAEILPRIFEPFFTTRSGGTGLGLSIIKNILDGHDGSLVVWNNPGCTVEVTLPLANGGDQ